MNASEIRQKFNSLDKAVTEIERLQNPSNSSSAQTASKPRYEVTHFRGTVGSRNQGPPWMSPIVRMTVKMVATLYAELNRRRGK